MKLWFEKYVHLDISKISSYFTEWILEQCGIITQLLPLVIARGSCVKESFSVNKLGTDFIFWFYLRDVNSIYIHVPLLCVHNVTECDVVIEHWEYSFEERESSNCKHNTYSRVFCTFNFKNNWAIMKYK